jgi:hypothetical protein
MSDVSSHEADHASEVASQGEQGEQGEHGHVPVDPNDAVLRAKAPSPRALLVATAAAVLTVAVLLAAAIASAQGA